MNKLCIITGSNGLVGSYARDFFIKKNFLVVGIDNNLRKYFFGNEGSTKLNNLKNFKTFNTDIRNYNKLKVLFKQFNSNISLIIHTAAQPSHDWAAREPITDFDVNAKGSLNLLELTRLFCPKAVFIYTSTNKVYGDTPNQIKLIEKKTRFELRNNHNFFNGIDESMSIDNSTHSLFGVSKCSADLMVQEYGRYFRMKTVSFRAGCITGPKHSSVELHGFLDFLVKCCIKKSSYKVIGYNGKQVRDNIHAIDLVKCFWEFYKKPKNGAYYNIGGSRFSNCSILEAIQYVEKKINKKIRLKFLKKK